MRKYGIENHYIELLETCRSQEELDEREFFYLNKYKDSPLILNSKFTKGKCGGDIFLNEDGSRKEEFYKKISPIISAAVSGGRNHNAKKIFALNVKTNEKLEFDCAEDGVKYFHLNEHSPITRRCNGKIKILLNGEWTFSYKKDEFNYNEHFINQNATPIIINDLLEQKIYRFPSFSSAEKAMNFPEGTIDRVSIRENNVYKKRYKVIRSVQTNGDECSRVGLEISTRSKRKASQI